MYSQIFVNCDLLIAASAAFTLGVLLPCKTMSHITILVYHLHPLIVNFVDKMFPGNFEEGYW